MLNVLSQSHADMRHWFQAYCLPLTLPEVRENHLIGGGSLSIALTSFTPQRCFLSIKSLVALFVFWKSIFCDAIPREEKSLVRTGS